MAARVRDMLSRGLSTVRHAVERLISLCRFV